LGTGASISREANFSSMLSSRVNLLGKGAASGMIGFKAGDPEKRGAGSEVIELGAVVGADSVEARPSVSGGDGTEDMVGEGLSSWKSARDGGDKRGIDSAEEQEKSLQSRVQKMRMRKSKDARMKYLTFLSPRNSFS